MIGAYVAAAYLGAGLVLVVMLAARNPAAMRVRVAAEPDLARAVLLLSVLAWPVLVAVVAAMAVADRYPDP